MAESMNVSIRIAADAAAGIEAFSQLRKTLAQNEAALKSAREEASRLAAQLKATGGTDAGLKAQFDAARDRAAALKKEVADGRERVELMRRSLAATGIDTRALHASMQQVAQAMRTAQEQSARLAETARQTRRLNEARGILGIDRDTTERDILRVQAALQRLKDSGRLSGDELARAMLAAKTRMAELRAESGGLLQSLARIKEQSVLSVAPLVGVGVLAASGMKNYVDLGRKLSEIRTLTGQSREEIRAFGADIRRLSQDMGKDATDLAAAAYNIISAGVAPKDALRVLELSAKAAVAGVADVNSTARLGIAVMNSYGGSVEHLESIYDTLFMTVKNGVTTIPELASSLSRVLPTAKEAGVSFDELTGALAQLTQNWGGQTAEAVTALNSAIMQLAAPTPEARKKLEELGITWNGLIDTIGQIKAKDLDVEAMRRIIPDVEGAKAVMSLAGAYDQLKTKYTDAVNAAGAARGAYGIVREDDKASVERLSKAWDELKRALGETLSTVLVPLMNAITGLLRGFNELDASTRALTVAGAALAVSWRGLTAAGDLLLSSLRLLPGAFAGFQASAMTALTTVKGGFLVLFSAVAGWSIGSYMREEFEVVEKAGVALVAGLLKGWARIEYAWERIKGIFKSGDVARQAQAELDRQLADVDDFAMTRFKEISDKHAGGAQDAAKKLPTPKPAGSNPFKEQPGEGRARFIADQFDAELAALKSKLKDEQDMLELSFRAKLITEQNYWREKERMQTRALDLEERELRNKLHEQQRALKTGGIDAAQAQQAKNRIAEIGEKIAALDGRRAVIAFEIKTNLDRVRQELDDLKAGLREKIAEATGEMTPELRRAAIERAYRDTLTRMREDAEGEALVRRAIDVEAAKSEMTALESAWRLALETMRNAETSANIQREQGLITTAEAQQRIAEAHRQAASDMDMLLPKLEAVAKTLGPEAAARVAAFRNELAGVQHVVDPVAASLETGIKGAFEEMFTSIGKGAKTAKEVFLDFARSVIGSIQRILAQQLAEKLFSKSGLDLGGVVKGALSFFGLKFASGGYVTGPGTSTSDSIPARLSAGEYVVRAEAVRRFGVAFLDAINGLQLPPPVIHGRLAFAAGGMVPAMAQPAPQQAIRIVNAVDPELARDYLESPAGERVILNVLSRNANAVRNLMG